MNRYQEIMRAVEADWRMGGLSDGIYGDFAATVARRSEERLKAALREALEEWEDRASATQFCDDPPWEKRIAALRKEFLDE